MVLDAVAELKNLVFEAFEFADYNRYFKAFNKGEYNTCAIMAEEYMEKARDEFFASLEKDMCDIGKAVKFHSAFKVFEKSLEYAARGLEINFKEE